MKQSLRLQDEERVVREALSTLHDEDRIEYHHLQQTTLEDIYDTFDRFHNRVAIFHFAGHSNSELIQLSGTPGNAKYLKTILAQQENLKLIFLNGCKNHRQVEELFKSRVPAVIATTANVDDPQAMDLASRFYNGLARGKTLREAFESARSFIAHIKSDSTGIYICRGIQFSSSEEQEAFPWGLYVQTESVLDIKITDIEKEFLKITDIEFVREELKDIRVTSRELRDKWTNIETGRYRYLDIKQALLAGIEFNSDSKHRLDTLFPAKVKMNNGELVETDSFPPLEERILQLRGEPCPHAVLLGAGGMGKTVSLIHLWEHFSQPENEAFPLPIFVPLNECNNKSIVEFIRLHYDFDLNTLSRNLDKVKGHDIPFILLLLDGFNEISTGENRIRLSLEIEDLAQRDNYEHLQILITSRYDMRKTKFVDFHHLLELQPLDIEHQVLPLLLSLGEPLPENDFLEVLRNPMMLSLYVGQSELPETYKSYGLLKQPRTCKGDLLYNQLMVERIKLQERFDDDHDVIRYRYVLEHLLPFFAWHMNEENIFFIEELTWSEEDVGMEDIVREGLEMLDQRPFDIVFPEFRGLAQNSFSAPDSTLLQVLDVIWCRDIKLLVKDDGKYRFLHQIFRDYLAACHVQNTLKIAIAYNKKRGGQVKDRRFPIPFQRALLNFNVRDFLGELEGEHTNKMEWNAGENKWQWRKEKEFFLKNNLAQMLQQCRGVFDREQLGYTVRNLLTIWKEQRGEFSGLNLSEIDLRGCSLKGIRASRPLLAANFSGSLINDHNFIPQEHTKAIHGAIFSPDNQFILTPSSDNTAKVWDANSGICILSLGAHTKKVDFGTLHHKGHTDRVNGAIFSPDGKKIVTASSDSYIYIWDVNSGEIMKTLEDEDDYIELNEIYDRPPLEELYDYSWLQQIGLEEYSEDELYAEKGYHTEGELEKTSDFTEVSCSPDGKYLLVKEIKARGELQLWDIEKGSFTSLGDFSCAAFGPDGKQIIFGSSDHKAYLRNINQEGNVRIFEGHSGSIQCVDFSPDGKYILTGSLDQTAKLWNAKTGDCLFPFEGDWEHVSFSRPKGLKICTYSSDKVKIWDVETRSCIFSLEGKPSPIVSSSFSNVDDGRKLITLSQNKLLKFWDVGAGILLNTFSLGRSQHRIGSADFSPDSKLMAYSSNDRTIRLWDIDKGVCKLTISTGFLSDADVTFSPVHPHILVSGDSATGVWHIHSGKCLFTINRGQQALESLAFSPKGNYILHTNLAGIKLLDAVNGDCLGTIDASQWGEKICDAIYTSDEACILVRTSKEILIYDTNTGKRLRALAGQSARIIEMALSRNNRYLVTSSVDHKIRVWDLATEAQPLVLPQSSHIDSIAISPDNRFFLSASGGETKAWNLQTGEYLFSTYAPWSRLAAKYHWKTGAHYDPSKELKEAYGSILFNPDGSYFATYSSRSIAKFDPNSGELIASRDFGSNSAPIVCNSRNGEYILVSSDSGVEIRDAKEWSYYEAFRLEIKDIAGPLIQGCKFGHAGKNLSDEAKKTLKQYGGVFDEEEPPGAS